MIDTEYILEINTTSQADLLSARGEGWLEKVYGAAWREKLHLADDSSVDDIAEAIMMTVPTNDYDQAIFRIVSKLNGLLPVEVAALQNVKAQSISVFYNRLEKQLQDEHRSVESLKPRQLTRTPRHKVGVAAVRRVLEEIPEGIVYPKDEAASWQIEALCAESDPELFFPEQGGSSALAKVICKKCDVRKQCLQMALDNKEEYGIWGGLTTRERKKLQTNSVQVKADSI